MTDLRLSDDLILPTDFATEGVAVIGMRGSGKSNTEVRFAEVLVEAGIPWVAIDPKGDWWGMRSSADGQSVGLSVPIFGGLHGDFPLEARTGSRMADLLVDENLSAILDVSHLSKTGDLPTFLTAFCNQLMHRHQLEPQVRTVILEEAHRYIPQVVTKERALVKEAAAAMLLEGRSFGLGCWAATQRPARLNKDVLEEVANAFIFRIGVAATNDKKAVKAWVEHYELGEEIVGSLTGLRDGQAWVLMPQDQVVKKVQMDRRRTFDSGGTPKVGAITRRPATLADINQAAIKEALVEVIERAEATDPKVLQGRIKQLERDLADALKDRPIPEPEVVRVEVPLLSDSILERLERLSALDAVAQEVANLRSDLGRIIEDWGNSDRQDVPRTRPAGDGTGPVVHGSVNRAAADRRQKALDPAQRADPPQRREPCGAAVPRAEAAEGLTEYSQVLLAGLARRHPLPVSKSQLATLSGRSHRSSMFNPSLAALVQAGYAEKDGSGYVATTAGLEVVGSVATVPQTAGARLAMWLQRLPEYEAVLLQVIVDAWPDPLTREQVSEASGRSLTSSMFKPSLTNLVRLELVTIDRDGCYTASDDLVQD